MTASIRKPGHVIRNMIHVEVVVGSQLYSIATNGAGEHWSTLHSHGSIVALQEKEAKEAAMTWAAEHPMEMQTLKDELARRKVD